MRVLTALDWAMGLQDTAELPISLIHRRERFRGLESSYNEVCRLAEAGGVEILVPCEVRAAGGNGRLEAITVENTATASMPRSWQARTSRTAASPRFAISNLPMALGAPVVDGGMSI